jgi:transcriptional regulator with PAS, ATPase and Fis domain
VDAYLRKYGTHGAEAYQLDTLTVIGYGEDAKVRLLDPSVERRHARIEKRDETYFIKDLRSSSGTYVNGTQVLEAILQENDRLQIGESIFIFSTESVTSLKKALKSNNKEWQMQLENLPSFARTDYPVLILGPSGSGKEILATEIHNRSSRKFGPFVSVNCSALTETLIESELFGHVKGSFTGAISDRKGAFESARGGTLFLDEIGDLPYSLQAKLLRALENQEIRPVGADKTVKTDVRILSATHQNLQRKIANSEFRSDLFYRLNVINIFSPPLKERMEDFDELLYLFCKESRVRMTHDAISILKKHAWPGNIRELKNVIARASAFYPTRTIDQELVSNIVEFKSRDALNYSSLINTGTPSNINLVKEVEKEMILKRLSVNMGNQRRTAYELGIPKSTLHDRIKEYAIDLKSFKTIGGNT